MIVVDASVAVKWFLNEEHTEESLAILETGRKLHAPIIAECEVAGSFSRALRRGDIDGTEAQNCFERWIHSLRTNVVSVSHDRDDVIAGHDLALKLEHPLADCVYLAMAKRIGATLVTADKPFFDKAKKKHKVVFITDTKRLAA